MKPCSVLGQAQPGHGRCPDTDRTPENSDSQFHDAKKNTKWERTQESTGNIGLVNIR